MPDYIYMAEGVPSGPSGAGRRWGAAEPSVEDVARHLADLEIEEIWMKATDKER